MATQTVKKICFWALLVLIGLFLLVQISSRIMFANVSHYKATIVKTVEDKIHKPVRIANIHATWYGFKPVLKLKNVDVLDDDNKTVIAHVDRLFLGIDLLDTLSHRKFEPKEFVLSGLSTDPLHHQAIFTSEIKWHLTRHGWVIRANNVPIASTVKSLLQLKLMPEDISETVVKSSPTGLIKNIVVERVAYGQFNVVGRCQNLSSDAHDNYPGFDHLDTTFNVASDKGKITLHAQNSTVTADNLFRNSIPVSKLNGEVTWHKDQDNFVIDAKNIDVKLPSGGVTSNVSITLNAKDYSPLIAANAEFYINDVANAKQYFPVGIMKPRLVSWLNKAFIGGKINQGKLVLAGRLDQFPFDQGEGEFLITAHAEQLYLNYKDDWPAMKNINADLRFENRTFKLIANHAQVMGQSFNSANANIKDLAHPVLHVNGRIQGDLEKGLAFVHQSPLEKGLGKRLAPLQLAGPMSLALHLRVPMDGSGRKIHVLGSVKLNDSTLAVPDWRLSIEKLNGQFKFDERSINSQLLMGTLFDDPVALKLSTITDDGDVHTYVDINGELNDVAIKNIVPISVLKNINGKAKFTARLKLQPVTSAKSDSFSLQSDLQGMAIDLPKPLKKPAEKELPFKLNVELNKEKASIFNVGFDNTLQLALKLWHKQLQSVAIHIGKDDAELPEKDGFAIDGKIDEFDVAKWMGALFSKRNSSASFPSFPSLAKVNLQVSNFILMGQTLRDVKLAMQQKAKAAVLTMRSSQVNGDVSIPNDFPHTAIDVNFDRFHLYKKKTDEKSFLQPNDLPPINVTVDEFSFEKLPLGRFELSLTPEKNSLKINQISFKSKLMSLSASGMWDKYDQYQKTVLSGAIYTHNLGTMLSVFDLTDNMMGGDGRALFNLHWGDSLINYDLSKLNGRVNLEFAKGQIVKLSNATNAKVGIGRVLNLFSLQSLPRRLALDFSDLSKDGFGFDLLNGHFNLQNGNAFSKDTTMQGAVATVNLQGRLGLSAKDYQLLLMITPHVTSSLPIVATVAGGPVAGVTTWVVEKIFRRAVNEVTTINYKVTGPWDHPNITKLQKHIEPPYWGQTPRS